jgi:tRNA A37 threonylcarbamoyladenosine biosynthesis protein TsaE
MGKLLPRALVHMTIDTPWFKIRVLEFKRLIYVQSYRKYGIPEPAWDTVQTYKVEEHDTAYRHASRIGNNMIKHIDLYRSKAPKLDTVDLTEIIIRDHDNL